MPDFNTNVGVAGGGSLGDVRNHVSLSNQRKETKIFTLTEFGLQPLGPQQKRRQKARENQQMNGHDVRDYDDVDEPMNGGRDEDPVRFEENVAHVPHDDDHDRDDGRDGLGVVPQNDVLDDASMDGRVPAHL